LGAYTCCVRSRKNWFCLFCEQCLGQKYQKEVDGQGEFRLASEVALQSGVAVSEDGREQAGMGVDFGDYNNDGNLDLVVTHFSEDYTTLYRNGGTG
jgi:enediyne biosynthesis protein E4